MYYLGYLFFVTAVIYIVAPVVVIIICVICFTVCIIRAANDLSVEERLALGHGPEVTAIPPTNTPPARQNISSTRTRRELAQFTSDLVTITSQGVSMGVPLSQLNAQQQELMLNMFQQQQRDSVQLSQRSSEQPAPSLATPVVEAELSSQVPPPAYDAAVAYPSYTPETPSVVKCDTQL